LKTDAALRNDLIELLTSTTDPEELTALAQLLAEALGEQAFPTLERVYTSKTDPALRRAALFMIGALGTETSRRYVLDVLRTAHSDEGRIAAVEALGYPWGARESEARQVVEALQELMSSREASTRLDGAVALLGWAHRPEHAALTADYLASETDDDSRYTVLQYLDGHALARDPKVFQTVRRIFEDPGAALELRQAAASVLADTLVVDDDLSKAIERFWNE
jgi:HEAT repeat protein